MDVTHQGEAWQRDLRDRNAALISARERIRELVAERDEALAERDRTVIERDTLRSVLTGQQQQPVVTFPAAQAVHTFEHTMPCPGCQTP